MYNLTYVTPGGTVAYDATAYGDLASAVAAARAKAKLGMHDVRVIDYQLNTIQRV